MMESWEIFMLESNRIEGEDRLNLGDKKAFDFAYRGIDGYWDILKLHRILGEHLKVGWVGKWRTCNVRVGSHLPPKFQNIPSKMQQYMVEYPRFDSYEAHNRFELIHPFRDLNGRVGRLIWLSKALLEGYDFSIPFLQKYYYQTLQRMEIKDSPND